MRTEKGKTLAPSKVPGAFQNQQAANGKAERKFYGTDNPRYLRAIAALMRRPISRQELDSVAGCANGPALVAELRDLGLTVPCERIKFIDRDGKPCRPGVYSFMASDRRKVHAWLAQRERRVT
jgi:hypothetical protein